MTDKEPIATLELDSELPDHLDITLTAIIHRKDVDLGNPTCGLVENPVKPEPEPVKPELEKTKYRSIWKRILGDSK